MADWRVIAAIFFGGTVLSLARRYGANSKHTDGMGVAGWTVFIIFLYVISF